MRTIKLLAGLKQWTTQWTLLNGVLIGKVYDEK